MKKIEKEFEQIRAFITSSRNRAAGFMNYAAVATYWTIGAYVSLRLASRDWGVKSVEQLCDYLKTREPKLRGFGQRQIYNMIEFFKAYSNAEFSELHERLKLDDFVVGYSIKEEKADFLQSVTAKIDAAVPAVKLQSVTAKVGNGEIAHSANIEFSGVLANVPKMPQFLALTTFTNHTEIINRCRSMEEKVFYILYSAHERLKLRELRRAIVTQTYESVMSKEKKMSRALKEKYPDAEFMLKDRAFLDFLNLPEKHNERQLHSGIRENIKKFILELGKDFLWMGDEYSIQVGDKRRRLDLLFYHRALRCLVDVELKAVPFEPEFAGKMDFYLAAIDDQVKREDENPSVGIILCPETGKYEVKYAIDRTMSPMMIAEYKRLLIPEEVMKKSLEEYCSFMKKEDGGLK